jgi:hypothetical protein
LLNILNAIFAVSVFDDTNDEVEPSAIRYCEEVPLLLTNELAVIVPFTCYSRKSANSTPEPRNSVR